MAAAPSWRTERRDGDGSLAVPVYTPAPKMNKTIAASSLRESAMHGARRVEPRAHAAARDGLLDGGAQQVGRGQLGLQLRAAPLLRVG